MKYKRIKPSTQKVGDNVRIVQKLNNLNTEVLGDTLWEVIEISKENPYVLKLKEVNTEYAGYWLDVSMVTKVN